MVKRKLPAWIMECALRQKRKLADKSRIFIHILDQPKTARIRENTTCAISILSMTRSERAFIFGERLDVPFYFSENNAVMCVMNFNEMIEVISEIRGNDFIQSPDFHCLMMAGDSNILLLELKSCLAVYDLQRACIVTPSETMSNNEFHRFQSRCP